MEKTTLQDVSVVQRRLRNVQKSVMHVQSCCFGNVNLLLFYSFSLPSPSSLLKVPTVVIQKFCYHSNVTSHFSSPLQKKRWMSQNSLKIQFYKTPTKSRAQTRNGELQPRTGNLDAYFTYHDCGPYHPACLQCWPVKCLESVHSFIISKAFHNTHTEKEFPQ